MHADSKEHQNCLACGSSRLKLLIDFGNMPLAGGFMKPDEAFSRNVTYPLRLANCPDCKSMQLLNTIAPDEIFRHYSFASNTTQSLTDHFIHLGEMLVRKFSAKEKLIVEIGCNDGVLVRSLLRAGALVIGVDPSDVALKSSTSGGWTLVNDYFSENTAVLIKDRFGRAGVVVGNNVFAHMEDIHSVVRGVKILLEDEGVLVMEVHYQGDLLKKNQFDMVYHEHIFYHSLTSLAHLFSMHGLKIIDVERIPTHAGSIRVAAAKEDSSHRPSARVAEMLEQEKDWDVARFVENVLRFRREFPQFIAGLKSEGMRIGAYGAAGRMTVLMNYCGLGPGLIDYVVDMSPLRYGRLVPGVLLPIVPPQVFHRNPLDYMIMTAWSYEAEILEKERAYLKNGGRFIVPLPELRVLGESRMEHLPAGG